MSVLKRAIIKSYTPASHKASVQIAGSLAVWLDAIPVATDIPAAECVLERECAVLFFTDDNPDDAVVITVHGAVPGAAPSPTNIKDADGNTRVETEQSPNEDIIRMTIAGTERYVMGAASPQHYLTGHLKVSGRFSVNDVDVDTNVLGLFREATLSVGKVGALADLGGTSTAPTNTPTGFMGRCWARASAQIFSYGLDYIAGSALSGHTMTETDAVRAQLTHLFAVAGLTITRSATFHGRSPNLDSPTGVFTTVRGLWLEPILYGDNRRQITEEGVSGLTADAHGNRLRSNTQVGSLTGAFGGGDGVLGIANATVAPTTTPAAGMVLYAEAGQLRARTSAGVKERVTREKKALTLANGNNNDIAIADGVFVRITGPSAAYTITGIAGGEDGRVVYLYGQVAFNMTIANENAGSAAANRIKTLTGANVTTTADGIATLIYDATDQRWILRAVQGL